MSWSFSSIRGTFAVALADFNAKADADAHIGARVGVVKELAAAAASGASDSMDAVLASSGHTGEDGAGYTQVTLHQLARAPQG